MLSLLSSDGSAFTVPPLSAPVVDEAGILSDSTVFTLNNELRRLHETGGTQVGVLTLKSLEGLEIEQVSIKVVDAWKLGSAAKDDGVLLLIAPVERRLRIEVGYGKEGDLPDALARRIIDQVIKPSFRNRDFDSGVIRGVASILSHTDPSFTLDSRLRSRQAKGFRLGSDLVSSLVMLGIILVWVFPFIIIFVILKIMRMMGIDTDKYLLKSSRVSRRGNSFGRWSGYGGSGGWSGGGGFGGGGWSGGGGGFGGGGSSGSW